MRTRVLQLALQKALDDALPLGHPHDTPEIELRVIAVLEEFVENLIKQLAACDGVDYTLAEEMMEEVIHR